MKASVVAIGLILSAYPFWFSPPVSAGESSSIVLPPPQTEGGKPLMQALRERRSGREFGPARLPPQVLSNLLWAADGISRPDSGKRTAPSAGNRQEIEIYAALPEGIFRYDAKIHQLLPILDQDIRTLCGKQGFVSTAPVVLIYVADFSKMSKSRPEDRDFYSAADTGFISQNVYLFCASEGLTTVVLGMVDKPALGKAMGLKAEQRVILTQPVGYPKQSVIGNQ